MILDSLPGDVYNLLKGKVSFDKLITDKCGDLFKEELFLRLSEKTNKATLRMSNIGRPLRQLWYEMNGFEAEEISGATLLKFTYGALTESLVLSLAEAAGHKVERQQEEVQIDGVLGHIDAVVSGVLVDVKSCSSYSFQKFKTGQLLEEGNDPFGYQLQLILYAKALNLPAAWIAFDKVSGEITVLHLPQQRIDEYDVSKRITTARATISSPEPPERCYPDQPVSKTDKSGNRILGVGCSYCGWKNECWKDTSNGVGLQVRYYSTGPKWFTKIVSEPRLKNNFTSPFEEKEGN